MNKLPHRLILAFAVALLAAPAAWASHPRADQMETVKLLAHRVEDAARHVHREAEERAHHGDREEEEALKALHRLENRARHFHREVERYYGDPGHTEHDFYRLLDAYEDALYAFPHLHGERHVRRDFDRLRRAMDELVRFYGVRGYDGHGYGRRGYGDYRHREQDRSDDRIERYEDRDRRYARPRVERQRPDRHDH